ncbi:MAG: hypothetical protein V2B19_03090 [Pseudomonadota bacterium]
MRHPEFYFPAKGEYSKKYGIDRFINPRQDKPVYLPFSKKLLTAFGEPWEDKDAAEEHFGPHRYRLFAFDVGFSLESRLKAALPVLQADRDYFLQVQNEEINEAEAHFAKVDEAKAIMVAAKIALGLL